MLDRHRSLVAVHGVLILLCFTGGWARAQVPTSADSLDLGPGIHAVLALPTLLEAPSPGVAVAATVSFVQVDVEGSIASYQGEVHFDADMFEITEVTFPPGVLGAWNVIEAGRLRFAGLVADGLPTPLAMELSLVPRRPLQAAGFRRIIIEEMTATTTFRDLTDEVVEHDPVVVVTGSVGTEPGGAPDDSTVPADGVSEGRWGRNQRS